MYNIDKAYLFGLKKNRSKNTVYIETDTDDVETNALKILDAAVKINWNRAGFIDE